MPRGEGLPNIGTDGPAGEVCCCIVSGDLAGVVVCWGVEMGADSFATGVAMTCLGACVGSVAASAGVTVTC